MRKIKGVVFTLVASLTLFSVCSAWAADSSTAKTTFTLDEVQEMVLQNNKSLEKLDISLDTIRHNQNVLINQQDDLYSIYVEKDYLESQLANMEPTDSRYATLKATIAAMGDSNGNITSRSELSQQIDSLYDSLKDTKHTKEETQANLKVAASKLYTNILALQENISLLTKQADLNVKQRELVQLKIALGMAADSDYLSAGNAVDTSASNLTTNKIALNSAKRALNDLMGRDVNAALNLEPLELDIVITSVSPLSDTQINALKDESYHLNALERDLKALEKDLNNEDDGDKKEALKLDIKSAKLALDEAQTTFASTAKSKNEAVTAAAASYTTAANNCTEALQALDTATLQYELGLLAAIDYEKFQVSALSAQNALASAGYDYYYAQLEYDYFLQGIDISSVY